MPSGCPQFGGIDTPKNCRVPDIWTGMWGVGSMELTSGVRALVPPPKVTWRVALDISEGLSGPPFL